MSFYASGDYVSVGESGDRRDHRLPAREARDDPLHP